MTSSCYFCLLLLMISLFHFCLSTQNLNHVLCKDVERHALLQFKHRLIDPAHRLASWVREDKDCCTWAGIVCDNFTGHVHRIHLRGLDGHCRDQDHQVSKQMLSGDLSPSLLHLKQLRHLDLSCNDFGGIQVPRFIGSLGNLRYLNLSGSGFGGIIPPQLGNLSELQVLCLDNLGSTRPMRNMQWLSSLHLLHHLDMSGMDLSEVINPFQVINTLSSLVALHLSNCQLSNMHPHVSTLNISSLSLLDLSNNNFNSFLPWWIFSITSLVSLDLSECGFHGPILGSFGFQNFTALKLLHVSGNDFMNSSLVLKGLSSIGSNLISLDIRSCGVSSSVLDDLHNLTSLLSLDMSQNQLTKRIPKSLGNLCDLRHIDLSVNDFPNISLTYLLESLFGCKSPSFPDSLGQLSNFERLHLSSNESNGSLPDCLGQLSNLNELYLWGNQLSGSLPDSLGQLSNLERLDLSSNQLSGSLPDSLGQLSNLLELELSGNQLSGSLPNSLGQLSNLERLDLQYNQLSGSLPDSLGQLSNLLELELSRNQLSGSLPDSLGQLSNLERLDLLENLLSGSLPDSLGQLSNLLELELSRNQLSGSLPNSLGQLSNLDLLYIYNNQLSGSLPDSLSQLSNLVELDFSLNLLTGLVTKAHLANLASLKILDGGGNNLIFRPQPVNWIPPFQLHELYLNSWDLGPQFPLWLQLLSDLAVLDISNTNISAPIPQSFWRSFPNLRYVDMSQNHIQGTLFSVPETLNVLDLSSNEFTGQLHHFMCPRDEKGITVLNLGNNQLTGVIPECWMKWPSLSFLNLENNNLSGEVPRTLGFSSNLHSLNMQGNKLSGRLPVSLMNLTELSILQLGRNELVGCIPTWFGTALSSLRILNLRLNNFDGNIPHELCYLTTIHILDLAYNNLSGNIPRCFHNFTVLSRNKTEPDESIYKLWLERESLVMKGREDIYTTTLGLVLMVDLSSNNFFGYIPSELTALHGLMSLNLSRNQLTGRIPEKIGDMKSLESFDLSSNKISGELPTSLSSLSFLSYFNVSYNRLTGRIPSSTQLQGFNESSFFGNNLCGDPLTKRCVGEVPDRDQEEGDDWSNEADWGLIISMVCGFVAGFWIIVAPLMVSRSWRTAYFRFLNGVRYMGYDVIHKIFVYMFCK